jgi:multidrug efflux pump subunit AcrA (membrane-fusion protein)
MNAPCTPARGLILALVIVVAAATRAGAQPPASVFVAPIVERPIAPTQKFVGTVMALRSSQVGSAVSGRIERFLVNEGDHVHRGQPLAVLRTKIIEAEVAAAQADLAARRAELLELKNGTRPEEILQAEARTAMAEANLSFRRLVLNRNRTAGAGVSPHDLDESIALYNQAEASIREAKATLKLLRDGPRQEKIAFAQARVDAQSAEVQRLQEQLERHTIYAPFDGYIAAEHADVGQWLLQGAPLVDVVELDTVEIEVQVLEDYVRFLRVGDLVPVEVGALPGQAFHGWISTIVPQGNVRSRTFPVKVRVSNVHERRLVPADPTLGPATGLALAAVLRNPVIAASALLEVRQAPLLKAGMFARVALPTSAPQRALLVSRDALVLGGPQRIIYVVDPQGPGKGKARAVQVELGASEGNFVQVIAPLKAGELAVVQGNERLQPGQDVVIAQVQRVGQ